MCLDVWVNQHLLVVADPSRQTHCRLRRTTWTALLYPGEPCWPIRPIPEWGNRSAVVQGPEYLDWVRALLSQVSNGTFPILSRDPSFQETIKSQGKQPVFEKNDG